MVLMIDNYDSFTYNLVQYLGELGADVQVHRNDQITVRQVAALNPSHIVLSPGPCTPNEAGICLELIRELAGKFPILGVCLGHQSIGQAFGGKVVRAREIMHGKTSLVHHDRRGLFVDMPEPFEAGRYHSLIAQPQSMPEALEVTARTDEGEIMGVRHRTLNVEGVQFHPESVLTPQGPVLMGRFLKLQSGKREGAV